MANRVIFVDEDPYLLKSLKRMFRSMRDTWQIVYAGSAEEAIATMEKTRVDVVLTELRLSGMDGIDLLKQTRRHWPRAVRIVMSGYTDRDVILNSVGVAHQFISKPWEDGQVEEAIQRAFSTQEIVDEGRLKAVLTRISALPSLPSIYDKIVKELKSQDPSISKVAQLISEDPSMTAKVMQMVNSSFFRRPVTITDPVKAVGILGLDTMEAIVLTAGLMEKFDGRRLNAFSIDELWRHSLKTGFYVKQISRAMDVDQSMMDSAYMAALLHDIGKLLLAYYLPEEYRHFLELVSDEGILPNEAELQAYGVSHADVGAYLLGLWGFPLEVIRAVRFHHHPVCNRTAGLEPLTLVHSANAILMHMEPNLTGDSPSDDAQRPILEQLAEQGGIDASILTGAKGLEPLFQNRTVL